MPPVLAFHLLLIAETEKETAPSYVWRKGAKTLEVYCIKSTITAKPNQFGYQKKKKKTKKETKRASEIVWEILCYYILSKRIVRSAKPVSYRHVLGIALIKRNVLCNQRGKKEGLIINVVLL